MVSHQKLVFVYGQISHPINKSSEDYEAWEIVNDLVLSSITNYVEKHITVTIVYTDLASFAWKDLEEHFNQGNGPLIYQLRYELYNLH